MSTHASEPFLIAAVVTLTAVAGYFLLRKSGNTVGQMSEKIITGFLGAFLLMGGSVKFFEPFTSMFANQIALSGLPFPTLSNFAGQFGEISMGLTLLVLLIVGKRIDPAIRDRIFYFANLVISFIMLVAVYVHLHPNVPAETLPLGTKPPYLTVFILALAGLNAFLHWRNQEKTNMRTAAA